MKGKTSITLSRDLLAAVDDAAGPGTSRSAFIERVLRAYLKKRERVARNAQELQRLNRGAAKLNREAADVLGYQASWADP
jgi:metal-responsive CopG/Arc/MetJ family transcriptional regulator